MPRNISRNNQTNGALNSMKPKTAMLNGNRSVEINSAHHVKRAGIELTLPSMNPMRYCYSHPSHVPPCKPKRSVLGLCRRRKSTRKNLSGSRNLTDESSRRLLDVTLTSVDYRQLSDRKMVEEQFTLHEIADRMLRAYATAARH